MVKLTQLNAETKEQINQLLDDNFNIYGYIEGYLLFACKKGKIDVVKTVIEYNLKKTNKAWNNKRINKPPIQIATRYGFLNIVKYLIEKSDDTLYYYIMHDAARYGHMDIIDYGLELGLDINKRNDRRKTVLNIACEYKQLDIINKFIALGAIVTNHDLLYTYSNFNEEENDDIIANIIMQLYIQGVNMNYQDYQKKSVLFYYTYIKNISEKKSVNFLISVCDLNIQDNDGYTALHYTCMFNNFLMAKMLIENGANTTIKNNNGFNPLYYAKTQEIKDLFK